MESSQTNDRTHVPCVGRLILNYWTIREVWSCKSLTPLTFWFSWGNILKLNTYVYQMGCDRAISCLKPVTHVPCGLEEVIYRFLIWAASTCNMDSLNILPVVIIVYSHFLANFGHIPPRYVHLKRFVYLLAWGQKAFIYVCVSNNGYPSIININEKTLELLSWATAGNARNTTLCWLARGTKADTVLAKLPDCYLCPLLIIILLSMFDPCPDSWPKIPDNFGIFVFHSPQDC